MCVFFFSSRRRHTRFDCDWSSDVCSSDLLAQIADLAVAAGFRPAWIETATEAEWEEFESAYQADEEAWLAAHPDHPEAAALRQRLDEHRSHWLRGYRGLLGLAYLTLIPVG